MDRRTPSLVIPAVVAAVFFSCIPSAWADLLVAGRNTNRVLAYDQAAGNFLGTFTSEDGPLVGPAAMTFGPDGNLYVSSRGHHGVVRYDRATGTLLDVFVAPGSGGLSAPTSLLFTPPGKGPAVPAPAGFTLMAVGAVGLLMYTRLFSHKGDRAGRPVTVSSVSRKSEGTQHEDA